MVILPMVPQYARMLQRNLLYTAVTRAEKMLILLGDTDSFRRCVENQSVNRKTTLKERLQSVIDDQPKESVETEKRVRWKKHLVKIFLKHQQIPRSCMIQD